MGFFYHQDPSLGPPKANSRICAEICFVLLFFLDLASAEKERLEEKQRAARRERSQDEEDWSTRQVFLVCKFIHKIVPLNIFFTVGRYYPSVSRVQSAAFYRLGDQTLWLSVMNDNVSGRKLNDKYFLSEVLEVFGTLCGWIKVLIIKY